MESESSPVLFGPFLAFLAVVVAYIYSVFFVFVVSLVTQKCSYNKPNSEIELFIAVQREQYR